MKRRYTEEPLRAVITPIERAEQPVPGRSYRQLGVRLWGEGGYEREPLDGGNTRYSALYQVRRDDVVVNKIWARNGSVALVPPSLDGCYVSGEFPTFTIDHTRLIPRWFHWLTKTSGFWQQCDQKSQGTSGKNRIRPEQFLSVTIPLPPLDEQRRIVARIEELAGKIEEARGLRREAERALEALLREVYRQAIEGAPVHRMVDVAPLVRRPVLVEVSETYHELGVRSFGKGTFHKAPITGASLGTKKVFGIQPGDLLFNIVFAWEGAVAVARPEDEGRIGSHRFLTCVPKENVATGPFLCYHFLTEHGLRQIGEASPGGAGRNRTLGLSALAEILVPVPPIEKQLWFDSIQKRADSIRRLRAESAELDALLPSILDRAFKGEL